MKADNLREEGPPVSDLSDISIGGEKMMDFLTENEKEEWIDIFKRWLNHPYWGKEMLREIGEIEDPNDLEERFCKNLGFGTGGLRGVLGVGPNRVNKLVVRRTTQGLANYLNGKGKKECNGVVIGYDTRKSSQGFAEDAARVLAGNDIKTFLFEGPCPTPLISYSIRKFNCLAGVMITGSHNPVNYNGYKIYSQDGVQILPGEAQEIAGEIAAIDFFKDINMLEDKNPWEGKIERLGEKVWEEYLEDLLALNNNLDIQKKELKIVFSPLHGTANHLVRRSLKEDGFQNVFPVSEQENPVPEIASVASLNPEERDAYKIAINKAQEVDADIILATDLDGDRVGCMARRGPEDYALLTGNEVGALMVDFYLNQLNKKNQLPGNGAIVKTIVTGELGAAIARSYGVKTINTLTGFKYIGQKINEFEETGNNQFLLGYEESCGYLVGTLVREKDAITASLFIARMADFLKKQGSTLIQRLEGLAKEFGYHKEDVIKINLTGQNADNKRERIMDGFRNISRQPDLLSRLKITEVHDYLAGKGFNIPSKQKFPLHLPVSNALYFRLEGDAWFCIRPSGTEPLLKLYFGVKESSKKEAEERLKTVKKDVLEMQGLFEGKFPKNA